MIKKFKEYSTVQKVLVVFGLMIILLFSPLFSFIFNLGSAVGMLIGVLLLILGIKLNEVKKFIKEICAKKWSKILTAVFALFLCAGLVYCSVVTVKVLSYGTDDKQIPKNTPAVILGCRVVDGKPGPMLQKRINAAYEYLDNNPEAVCILSGGQGADESVSEAEAMYVSLCEKGISADRLIKEDKSANTSENFKFSRELAEQYDLGDNIVVVTNDFHQYRADILARKNGFNTYAVSASSGIFSLPTNVVREWFSVLFVIIRN